jgi:UDP-N-acetylglucosamine 2-epimerase (non-hydrolysing)
MKLAILVGTRPEIVKMAPIMRAADELGVEYAVIHTGQHYSFEMDGIFFDELRLRPPDINLGVGSGSHPFQLAAMIGGLEAALLEVEPDIVLVVPPSRLCTSLTP